MTSTTSRRIVVAAMVVYGTAIASAAEPARPKVEFVKVDGVACLQPVKLAKDAVFADFEAAEERWLDAHYPNYDRPRFERVFTLPPEGAGLVRPDDATVRWDVVHLRSPGGRTITKCFDFVPWDYRDDIPNFAVYRPGSLLR
jgi:hypothetical protein